MVCTISPKRHSESASRYTVQTICLLNAFFNRTSNSSLRTGCPFTRNPLRASTYTLTVSVQGLFSTPTTFCSRTSTNNPFCANGATIVNKAENMKITPPQITLKLDKSQISAIGRCRFHGITFRNATSGSIRIDCFSAISLASHPLLPSNISARPTPHDGKHQSRHHQPAKCLSHLRRH